MPSEIKRTYFGILNHSNADTNNGLINDTTDHFIFLVLPSLGLGTYFLRAFGSSLGRYELNPGY